MSGREAHFIERLTTLQFHTDSYNRERYKIRIISANTPIKCTYKLRDNSRAISTNDISQGIAAELAAP